MGSTARGEHPDLDTWLDLVRGLLSTQEQQAALDHVATCRECEEQFRHTAASNARGQAVLSSIGGAAPPGRAAASAARVRRLPVWVWTAAAAAVVTGFVIGVPVLRRATERRVAVPTVTLPSAKLRGAILTQSDRDLYFQPAVSPIFLDRLPGRHKTSELERMLDRIIGKNIGLTIRNAPDLGRVRADATPPIRSPASPSRCRRSPGRRRS